MLFDPVHDDVQEHAGGGFGDPNETDDLRPVSGVGEKIRDPVGGGLEKRGLENDPLVVRIKGEVVDPGLHEVLEEVGTEGDLGTIGTAPASDLDEQARVVDVGVRDAHPEPNVGGPPPAGSHEDELMPLEAVIELPDGAGDLPAARARADGIVRFRVDEDDVLDPADGGGRDVSRGTEEAALRRHPLRYRHLGDFHSTRERPALKDVEVLAVEGELDIDVAAVGALDALQNPPHLRDEVRRGEELVESDDEIFRSGVHPPRDGGAELPFPVDGDDLIEKGKSPLAEHVRQRHGAEFVLLQIDDVDEVLGVTADGLDIRFRPKGRSAERDHSRVIAADAIDREDSHVSSSSEFSDVQLEAQSDGQSELQNQCKANDSRYTLAVRRSCVDNTLAIQRRCVEDDMQNQSEAIAGYDNTLADRRRCVEVDVLNQSDHAIAGYGNTLADRRRCVEVDVLNQGGAIAGYGSTLADRRRCVEDDKQASFSHDDTLAEHQKCVEVEVQNQSEAVAGYGSTLADHRRCAGDDNHSKATANCDDTLADHQQCVEDDNHSKATANCDDTLADHQKCVEDENHSEATARCDDILADHQKCVVKDEGQNQSEADDNTLANHRRCVGDDKQHQSEAVAGYDNTLADHQKCVGDDKQHSEATASRDDTLAKHPKCVDNTQNHSEATARCDKTLADHRKCVEDDLETHSEATARCDNTLADHQKCVEDDLENHSEATARCDNTLADHQKCVEDDLENHSEATASCDNTLAEHQKCVEDDLENHSEATARCDNTLADHQKCVEDENHSETTANCDDTLAEHQKCVEDENHSEATASCDDTLAERRRCAEDKDTDDNSSSTGDDSLADRPRLDDRDRRNISFNSKVKVFKFTKARRDFDDGTTTSTEVVSITT